MRATRGHTTIRAFVFVVIAMFFCAQQAFAETATFTYDSLNRLTSATYGTKKIEYTYDSAGNLTRVYAQFPILTQATPVPSPTRNTEPSYTFNSSEAGTITYGGSCTSATTDAIAGDNTIDMTAAGGGPLADGTYSDCTITVTDAAGNPSSALNINTFVVDTSAPTDGLLAASAADTQIILDWTAASDTGGGLAASPYKLVRAQGTTPPADCSGTAIYEGSALTYSDTGLTNNQPYAYRLCSTDAAGNTSSGVTASATPEPPVYILTVTKMGTGSGDVTDNAGKLTWINNTGTGSYTAGAAVDLSAAAQSCSSFGGWGASCSGNTSPCSLTMDTARNVTATFTLNGTAWNTTSDTDYSSIQGAYTDAADGDLIEVQGLQLNEDVLIDRPISVTIKGGYDCDFNNSASATSINSLTITNGTVILDDVDITGP